MYFCSITGEYFRRKVKDHLVFEMKMCIIIYPVNKISLKYVSIQKRTHIISAKFNKSKKVNISLYTQPGVGGNILLPEWQKPLYTLSVISKGNRTLASKTVDSISMFLNFKLMELCLSSFFHSTLQLWDLSMFFVTGVHFYCHMTFHCLKTPVYSFTVDGHLISFCFWQ